ncbi:hypothetical protein [Tortoise microvirus 85]|nr:hypothetical protein [Tortoise microvirus 85]
MDEQTLKSESTQLESQENNAPYGDMSKNVKTYERKAKENTPFIIHHSEDEGWSAGIAEHRLTGWYKTEKDLETVLKGYNPKTGINWDLLTGVILILIEKQKEYEKLQKEINKRNK